MTDSSLSPHIAAGPDHGRYSVHWLRERFSRRWDPSRMVASDGFEPPPAGGTPAAVLVPLVMRESGTTMLLTLRTAHLNDHAGQVSFPGGRCEPGDRDVVHTALREAEEEVGLSSSQVEVIGRLPEYLTGTGFRVTPVVGLVTPPLNLKLDDFEVAEVFEPPLPFLMETRNWQRHSVHYQGQDRAYWSMPWQGYFIWGATAGMIVNLQRHLTTGE